MYYQATWLFNALVTGDMLNKEWRQAIDTLQTAPIDPRQSIYFYMLCSNRNLKEAVSPVAAISEHWSERRKQEYEQGVRKHIEDQGTIMRHQKNELDLRDARIEDLQKKLQETERDIAHLYDIFPRGLVRRLGSLKRKIFRK